MNIDAKVHWYSKENTTRCVLKPWYIMHQGFSSQINVNKLFSPKRPSYGQSRSFDGSPPIEFCCAWWTARLSNSVVAWFPFWNFLFYSDVTILHGMKYENVLHVEKHNKLFGLNHKVCSHSRWLRIGISQPISSTEQNRLFPPIKLWCINI